MELGPENAVNRHRHSPPATELASSSILPDARSRELFLRLKEGQKKKFCCDGKIDKQSGISYSSDKIIGLIERGSMVLVPAAITPHGHTSLLFITLLYEHDTEPHRLFRDRPNANICEASARSTRVSHNILGKETLYGELPILASSLEVHIRQWTHAAISTSPSG